MTSQKTSQKDLILDPDDAVCALVSGFAAVTAEAEVEASIARARAWWWGRAQPCLRRCPSSA